MRAQNDCENVGSVKIYSESQYRVKPRACGHAQNKQLWGFNTLLHTYVNLNPNKIIRPFSAKTLSHSHFETKFVKIHQ